MSAHEQAEAGRWGFATALIALVGPTIIAWGVSRGRAKRRGTPELADGFRRLIVGDDNRLSTSKTIAVAWTYTLAAALLSTVIAKWFGHPAGYNATVGSGLEGQYGLLIGGPLGAAILAKQIVNTQTATDPSSKTQSQSGPAAAQLIVNDAGDTDLGDLQYVIFNFVALIFFVGELLQTPQAGIPKLPDVLIGLTSVAAVGYVGKKALPPSASQAAPSSPPSDTSAQQPAPKAAQHAAIARPAATLRNGGTSNGNGGKTKGKGGGGTGGGSGSGGGGGSGGGAQPNYPDGTLLQAQGSTAIYVVLGGAKLLVPSDAELAALGYTRSEAVTTSPGVLAQVPNTPRDLTVVQERGNTAWWSFYGGKRVLIPTRAALRALGVENMVLLCPVGSLAGFPETRLPSDAATPPSMVFAPKYGRRWEPPNNAKWYPREEVPGITLPNGVRAVRLRGWLSECSNEAAGDPDWHALLEPEPAWLDAIGVDWPSFVKVGDILEAGRQHQDRQTVLMPQDPTDRHAYIATPNIKIELDGWTEEGYGDSHAIEGNFPGARGNFTTSPPELYPTPADWLVSEAHGKLTDWSQASGLEHVSWAFALGWDQGIFGGTRIATQETGDADYVEVAGSLVHDIPHIVGAGNDNYAAAATDWGGAGTGSGFWGHYNEYDHRHMARYSEMHSPDRVSRARDASGSLIPAPSRQEYVFAIALIAHSDELNPSSSEETAMVQFSPPLGARRGRNTIAVAREYVGPETNPSTIVVGNPSLNGAQITPGRDFVTVHVAVRGAPFAGTDGRFKATYRVYWAPDGGLVDVPYVAGQEPTQAISVLRAAGLQGAITASRQGHVERPVVATQQPTSGSLVAPGTTVQLTVTEPEHGHPQP